MGELIILKIGGSVCTEKDENRLQAKEETIRRIAREIKEAQEKKEFNLILVHGAGPFGHKLVKEYEINDGLKSEKDFEVYRKTQESVKRLNGIFVKIFAEEGIELKTVVPHECITQKRKKIVNFNITPVRGLLEKGAVPVLYGDMVPDEELKGSVVSGDAIVAFLAKELKPDKVLLGTDVDGIFTADPKVDGKAKLVERIDGGNFERILKQAGEAKTVDVTQGMKGKLLKLKEMLQGTKALIFNANMEGNIRKALLGEKIRATELKFQK
ncbi:MAG: isopentenyl phosphate kinase [Candidatus Diapherotrites archaeon]